MNTDVSQLVRFVRVCSNVSGSNNKNKCFTINLLNINTAINHKLHNAFSKFSCLLKKGKLVLYGDLVYEFK